MNGTFEWGVVIATYLSVLSIMPRHCARLTFFLHPKLRKINAVLLTPQLITLTLRRLRRAGSIPLIRNLLVPLPSVLTRLDLLALRALQSHACTPISGHPQLVFAGAGLSRPTQIWAGTGPQVEKASG